jgi:hypothetical protein
MFRCHRRERCYLVRGPWGERRRSGLPYPLGARVGVARRSYAPAMLRGRCGPRNATSCVSRLTDWSTFRTGRASLGCLLLDVTQRQPHLGALCVGRAVPRCTVSEMRDLTDACRVPHSCTPHAWGRDQARRRRRYRVPASMSYVVVLAAEPAGSTDWHRNARASCPHLARSRGAHASRQG